MPLNPKSLPSRPDQQPARPPSHLQALRDLMRWEMVISPEVNGMPPNPSPLPFRPDQQLARSSSHLQAIRDIMRWETQTSPEVDNVQPWMTAMRPRPIRDLVNESCGETSLETRLFGDADLPPEGMHVSSYFCYLCYAILIHSVDIWRSGIRSG